MTKNMTILCTAGSLLIILDSMNAGKMFMMFLFNGIIPGTDFSLSPTVMLSLMIVSGSVVFMKLIAKPLSVKYIEIEKANQANSRRKLKHA